MTVGEVVAADLRSIDIHKPEELAGKDPFAMYQQLSKVMGVRHDPCMLDVLICAVRFVEGGHFCHGGHLWQNANA